MDGITSHVIFFWKEPNLETGKTGVLWPPVLAVTCVQSYISNYYWRFIQETVVSVWEQCNYKDTQWSRQVLICCRAHPEGSSLSVIDVIFPDGVYPN